MDLLVSERAVDREQLSVDLTTLAPRLEDETDEEYRLFCHFVCDPPSRRRVAAVARQFGVSPTRVAAIAVARRWVERARDHDLAVLASLRADLAREIIDAARATTDLIRAVTQRILDNASSLEFSSVQIDRILNALSNILPVLFQLMPGDSGQTHSPAAVQNVVLMQLMQMRQDDSRALPTHTGRAITVSNGQNEITFSQ